MTTSTSLRLLASLLLATSAVTLGACGSTVTGGDDGSTDDGADDGSTDDGSTDDGSTDDGSDDGSDGDDGGTGCDEEFLGDCVSGAAICVDGTWICEQPECPAEAPAPDSACTGGLSCQYEGGFCGDGSVTYTCIDGRWSEAMMARCSPVECPEIEPTVGTTCEMWGAICEYESEMDCGPASITYTCDEGVWAYAGESVPRCALPDCRDLGDASSCAEFGCRWLQPGCDENPLAAAGCFAATPCDVDGCFYSDEVCTQVSIDPCAGSDCDACGQQEMLCIATTGAER